MYLYHGLCYSAATSVYSAMAADCPPVTSSGDVLACSAVSNGYTVQVGTGTTITVNPILQACVPELSDASALGGLVVAALASVFALKILWRAL